jgi:hypothetical protein
MMVHKSEDGTFVYMQEPLREQFDPKTKWFMLRVNDPKKTYWELFIIGLAIYNSF